MSNQQNDKRKLLRKFLTIFTTFIMLLGMPLSVGGEIAFADDDNEGMNNPIIPIEEPQEQVEELVPNVTPEIPKPNVTPQPQEPENTQENTPQAPQTVEPIEGHSGFRGAGDTTKTITIEFGYKRAFQNDLIFETETYQIPVGQTVLSDDDIKDLRKKVANATNINGNYRYNSGLENLNFPGDEDQTVRIRFSFGGISGMIVDIFYTDENNQTIAKGFFGKLDRTTDLKNMYDLSWTDPSANALKYYVYRDDPFQINSLRVPITSQDVAIGMYLPVIKIQAKGTWGDVKWYIDMEGILHIGGGTPPGMEPGEENKKSPWSDSYGSIITGISFDKKLQMTNRGSYAFSMLPNVVTVKNLQNVSFGDDTHRIDIGDLFAGDDSIKELDFSNTDFSHVDSMWGAFREMKGLENIYLSGVVTTGVNTVRGLFQNDSSLKSVDLSSFDTTGVPLAPEDADHNFNKYYNSDSMFDGAKNIEMITFGEKFDKDTRLYAPDGFGWIGPGKDGQLLEKAPNKPNDPTGYTYYQFKASAPKGTYYRVKMDRATLTYIDNVDEDIVLKTDDPYTLTDGAESKEVDILDMYASDQLTNDPFKNYVYEKDPLQEKEYKNLKETIRPGANRIKMKKVKAKGKWGSVNWYLDLDGTLHLGSGTTSSERPFNGQNLGIKKVVVEGSFGVEGSADKLFSFEGEDELTTITGLENVVMNFATSMDNIFVGKNITTLEGYEAWNIEGISSAKEAFAGVPKVKELDFSKWQTTAYTEGTPITNFFGTENTDLVKVTFGPRFQWNVTFPKDSRTGKNWWLIDDKDANRPLTDIDKIVPIGTDFVTEFKHGTSKPGTYILSGNIPFENKIPMAGSKDALILVSGSIFFMITLVAGIVWKRKKEAEEEAKELEKFLKK